MEEVIHLMKDEGLSMYTVSNQYHMMEQPERLHKKSFWNILTANIAKLLVVPPYIMK